MYPQSGQGAADGEQLARGGVLRGAEGWNHCQVCSPTCGASGGGLSGLHFRLCVVPPGFRAAQRPMDTGPPEKSEATQAGPCGGGGGESDSRCCQRRVMKPTSSFLPSSEQPRANGFASPCSYFFPHLQKVSEIQPLPIALYVL